MFFLSFPLRCKRLHKKFREHSSHPYIRFAGTTVGIADLHNWLLHVHVWAMYHIYQK